MRTKRTQPIDRLFPQARTRVLSLLLLSPGSRWHVRDIARRVGGAVGSIHRELNGLAEAGVVERVQDGNRTYYQANASCPFLPELSGLMRKTAGLADILRAALAPMQSNIQAAFIYGSQAAGTATAKSDVDLLVVGDVDDMKLHKAVSRAEERLGRAVNYRLMSREEYQGKRKEKGGFLARVLAGAKIFVIGTADEL